MSDNKTTATQGVCPRGRGVLNNSAFVDFARIRHQENGLMVLG